MSKYQEKNSDGSFYASNDPFDKRNYEGAANKTADETADEIARRSKERIRRAHKEATKGNPTSTQIRKDAEERAWNPPKDDNYPPVQRAPRRSGGLRGLTPQEVNALPPNLQQSYLASRGRQADRQRATLRTVTKELERRNERINKPLTPPQSRTGGNSNIKAISKLANTTQNTAGEMEWSPDPQIVLLLGIGLIITNLLVKSPTIARTLARFVLPPKEWQKVAQDTPSGINGWSIFGEIVFVVILYIVANISDTLSRAALLFECALYLLLFVFYGPTIIQHITGISGMYSNLTHYGGPEYEPPKPGIK
jgi:hypothetical protein